LPDCAAFCDGQREIMEIYGCMALHGRECDAFKTCTSKAARGVRRKGEEGKMGPKRP
jgi:hypothetical protein